MVVDAAWTADLAWRAATGRHLIGGTEYMWDARYPAWLRALSLFHVVLTVALVLALRKTGYDRRGPALQVVIAAAVMAASRAAGPAVNANFAFTDPILRRSLGPAPVHLLAIVAGLAAIYAATGWVLRRTLPAPAAKAASEAKFISAE
jgi:hypothetical protein